MNALLLLAALSSQITFNTTQQGMCIPLFLKSLLLNLVCAEYKYCPCAKAVQGKVRRSKKRPFHCLLINPLL
ncbi:curli assembly protein CsgC [Escherichia coli]|nr:curli assembly protein CsgC [Escherichia coli]